MTNSQAASLWGRVNDFLLGHVVDCHGGIHHMSDGAFGGWSGQTAQCSDAFWHDGYSDPEFYEYMRRKQ